MARIRKCVITAAGTGTRLLPFTKEGIKEMMPVYAKGTKGIVLKPIIQIIYESVFDFGIRDFCFVVRKKKRAINDHFTINKNDRANGNAEIGIFLNMISQSEITYAQQKNPRGFGDAVSKSKSFVGEANFLLHAGDDIILSPNNDHLQRLEDAFFKYNADVAFLIDEMDDVRAYGVIEGAEIERGIIKIKALEEKPKKPKSNMGVIAIYIFKSSVFSILEKARSRRRDDMQLSDAVKIIIDSGNAIGVKIKRSEMRIDVGMPESYVNSVNASYQFSTKGGYHRFKSQAKNG